MVFLMTSRTAIWPVVVKVKSRVVEGDLIQHLRDLADLIESHTKPEDLKCTLAESFLYCGPDSLLEE